MVEEIAKKLTDLGYMRVSKVSVGGEFTLRGEVLDIYLSCDEDPYRIVFDFDTIENIKTFSVETQTTIDAVDRITIYPSKEILWTDDFTAELDSKLRETFKKNQTISDEYTSSLGLSPVNLCEKFDELLEKLESTGEAEGEELLYPALFDRQYSVLDYINDDTLVFYYDFDRLQNSRESLQKEFMGSFKKARPVELVLSPEKILFDFDRLCDSHDKKIIYKSIHTQIDEEDKETKSIQLINHTHLS